MVYHWGEVKETKLSMDELLKNWNIGTVVSGIEPISSYWGKTARIKTVDGHCFILKEKSDLGQAEQESNLLADLSKMGAPVAVPILAGNSERVVNYEGRIFCLYPELSGETIVEHYAGNAMARAEAFGKAIGFLHTCLLKWDTVSGYHDLKLMEQIREWAIPCIREGRASIDPFALETIWNDVEREFGPLYAQLPQQLIHRDPHPGNMLFAGGLLTGFVDFEMVVRGPRIFDICYCGTSLLASGFPDTEKMQSWPDLFRALVKGYQKFCPLATLEVRALYGMLAAIEIIFAAFGLETWAEGSARINAGILQWLSANRELITV